MCVFWLKAEKKQKQTKKKPRVPKNKEDHEEGNTGTSYEALSILLLADLQLFYIWISLGPVFIC